MKYRIWGGLSLRKYWREDLDAGEVPKGTWLDTPEDATIYDSEEKAMKRAQRIHMSGSALPHVGWEAIIE